MSTLVRRVAQLETRIDPPTAFHIVHCRCPDVSDDNELASYCRDTGCTVAPSDTVVFVRYADTCDTYQHGGRV